MVTFIQQWVWLLLFTIGMLLFLAVFAADLRERGISTRLAFQLLLLLTAAVLVGQRALWVGRFWSYYADRGLTEILSFWRGGMDSSGGIILAVVVIIMFCKYNAIPLVTICDAGATGAGWIIGISRIGCFIEGDDWGIPTNSFLGVEFAPHQVAFKEQVALGLIPPTAMHSLAVHPTQLYLSALGFVIAFLFTFVLRNQSFTPGVRAGSFLLLYGVGRFLLEFLRGDDVSRGIIYGLGIAQWTMLGLCLAGFGFLLTRVKLPDSRVHA